VKRLGWGADKQESSGFRYFTECNKWYWVPSDFFYVKWNIVPCLLDYYLFLLMSLYPCRRVPFSFLLPSLARALSSLLLGLWQRSICLSSAHLFITSQCSHLNNLIMQSHPLRLWSPHPTSFLTSKRLCSPLSVGVTSHLFNELQIEKLLTALSRSRTEDCPCSRTMVRSPWLVYIWGGGDRNWMDWLCVDFVYFLTKRGEDVLCVLCCVVQL